MKEFFKSKNFFVMIIVILVIIIGVMAFFIIKDKKENTDKKEPVVTDAIKFKEEYKGVTENNPYVFKSANEVIKLLESGTGIILLGFPECKWCQSYAVYLEQVAKDYGISKIGYYNIRQIREENTVEYQKIVSLLGKNLDKDDKGNPRVFVPNVTFVKDGKIVGNDNESALLSSGEPETYWTDKKVKALKEKLSKIIMDNGLNQCDTCN